MKYIQLPIFVFIALHILSCEVFALRENIHFKRPLENYPPQKSVSPEFMIPHFTGKFSPLLEKVATTPPSESEKLGDSQKTQINSLLYINFRNRFRKEFEILKMQGIKRSKGDTEMLILYYDAILVEIEDRITLLGDTQGMTGPKKSLFFALEAYKKEVEHEIERVESLF